MTQTQSREKTAMRAAWVTIAGNVLLSLFKLFAGIFGHSAAMLSDAVHSLSDVFSTGIVMVGVHLSGKAADKEHPYGHERFECVAAILLAGMLFATGAGIGYGGLRTVLAGDYQAIPIPGVVALAAAVISIVTKEAMYWYTRSVAVKIRSDALMADAWHHRSDALSSVGSFAGIFGARMGFPVLDSVACLVISLFIIRAAYDIFREAVAKMVDKSCDQEMIDAIAAIVVSHGPNVGIDKLQTRIFGDKIYVDLEISMCGEMTLSEAHAMAHVIHDAIEAGLPDVKHCMIHVNPAVGKR